MATSQSFSQLLQAYYNTIKTLNPNLAPDIQGTAFYFYGNSTSQVAANVLPETQLMQNNIIPASATGTFLDKHDGSLGMTPRQPALPSQGHVTNLVANSGTTAAANFVIPVNTQLTSSSTNQTYNVIQAVSVAAGDTLADVVMQIQSVNLGAGTNSPPNDILTFVTPFVVNVSQSILTASVTSDGMTSGADIESDNSLVLRIFDFMINPRGGGSKGDYIKWCFLGSSNVTQATVIPSYTGNDGILFPVIFEGSPDPNFYIDGNATNNYQPTPAPINRTAIVADIDAVQTYINGVRPEGANPEVITVATYELSGTDPIFGNGSYFDVNVSLTPGLTLSTNILVSNGSYLTVQELIEREFRRAILQTPSEGTAVTISTVTNQYIIVSDIERTIQLGLANNAQFQGNYAAILVGLEIEYHAQGSPTPTYYVPIPSINNDNLFIVASGLIQAYLVYDIDVTMININII